MSAPAPTTTVLEDECLDIHAGCREEAECPTCRMPYCEECLDDHSIPAEAAA